MMSSSMGPQGRRRLGRLAHEAETAVEGDRRFFKRHVGRSYRVRAASQAEVGVLRQAGSADRLRAGDRWFVAVRQIGPGLRIRAYFGGPADNETDVTEAECRWLYERAKPPAGFEIERQLEDALADLRRGASK